MRAVAGLTILLVGLVFGCAQRRDDGAVRDVTGDGVIRVVVIGDSNSDPEFRFFPQFCEALATMRPDWDVICKRPYALAGATVALQPVADAHAWAQTTAALAEDPDALIYALGTNDIRKGTPPELIVTWLLKIRDDLVPDRLVYVATIPYASTGANADQIAATNARLRNAFPWIIDHTTGFDVVDYDDELHFTRAAQQERARRALAVLDPAGD